MSVSLPVDVLYHVADALSADQHPYGHAPDEFFALHSLSLTTRALHHICVPRLYASIVLHSSHQRAALIRTFDTSPSLAQHVRALSFCVPAPDSESDITEHFTQLCQLLKHLRISLRYLLIHEVARVGIGAVHCISDVALPIGRSGQHSQIIRDKLSNTFDTLTSLEEFVIIRNTRSIPLFSRPAHCTTHWPTPCWTRWPTPCWTHWPTLRRLALREPTVSAAFVSAISSLPSLTHLCLDQPLFPFEDLPAFEMFLRGPQPISLRRVMIIGYADHVRNAATMARDGLEVVQMKLGLPRYQLYVRNMTLSYKYVENGGLWEDKGVVDLSGRT